MLSFPKWKMLAASAASALPSSRASRTCSSSPAPPLAMTGIPVASDTSRVYSRSYPSWRPSASMLVTSSSPAPSSAARLAHFTASIPVRLRPPWV